MSRLISFGILIIVVFLMFFHARILDIALSTPVGFYLSRVSQRDLGEVEEIEVDKDIIRIANLMAWVFDSITLPKNSSDYKPFDWSHPYWDVFKTILAKRYTLCGGMSSLFAFTANNLGYKTRMLHLVGPKYVKGSSMYDTHAAVEVKLKEKNQERWVLVDPTFDAFWSCGGEKFISYPRLQSCLAQGLPLKPIHMRLNSKGRERLKNYYLPPHQVFYAGRAVNRFKSYGWSSFFSPEWWRRWKKRNFQEEAYELPHPNIVEDSITRWQEKNSKQ